MCYVGKSTMVQILLQAETKRDGSWGASFNNNEIVLTCRILHFYYLCKSQNRIALFEFYIFAIQILQFLQGVRKKSALWNCFVKQPYGICK